MTVENKVENTKDEEKNVSKWALDPLCINSGLTKGILYRACRIGVLKHTRYSGTKALRIKRSDILRFIASPELVNEVV
jgi:hypothetical protein